MDNARAFNDPVAASKLVAAINKRAEGLPTLRIMEVCGTHTMAIGRMGIRQLLPKNIELVSGPGCPVCVTPASYIDTAANLALSKRARIATFGDMFRVPGSGRSFAEIKAEGAPVEVVTSPLAALDMARSRPFEEVVFTAVGFETTIPSTASAVRRALDEKLGNISFLVAHRLVPPALDVLIADPSLGIGAFMLPGHVSAIIGEEPYQTIVKRNIPGVITGFEPLDILAGVLTIIDLVVRQSPAIKNEYTRVVHPQGSPAARALIEAVYEPCDAVWRGIGALPGSGLRLRKEFARLDAAVRFGLAPETAEMPGGCRCGDVLKGKLRPDACPLFGKACTPDRPVGPCMVSSEGSCAACFKYGW
jgi:hydrogenase expression/formation protein HypD